MKERIEKKLRRSHEKFETFMDKHAWKMIAAAIALFIMLIING